MFVQSHLVYLERPLITERAKKSGAFSNEFLGLPVEQVRYNWLVIRDFGCKKIGQPALYFPTEEGDRYNKNFLFPVHRTSSVKAGLIYFEENSPKNGEVT